MQHLQRRLIAVSLSAFFLLAGAPAFCDQERFDLDMSTAKAFIDNGDYRAAEKLLRMLNEWYPENPRVRALWGLSLSELEPEYAGKAVRLLESTSNLYPDNPVYHTALCKSYLNLDGEENINAAVRECDKAMKIAPSDAAANRTTGAARLASGDPSGALKFYKASDGIKPGVYETFYGLGRTYFALKNYREALAYLRKAESAAAKSVSNASAHEQALIQLAIGDTYSVMGRRKAAVEAYAGVDVFEPAGPVAELARSNAKKAPDRVSGKAVLAELVRYDAQSEIARQGGDAVAAPKARKLSESEQAQFAKCAQAAQRLFEQSDAAGAADKYKACLEIQPGDANAHISLAGVLLTMKKYQEAKREFEIGVRLLPEDSPMTAYCRSRQGDIEFKAGQLEKAATYYAQALALNPSDVNAQVGVGKCYEEKKDFAQAAEAYRLSVALEPTNTIAREGLRRIEPFVMTDPEILAEMKERKAIPQETEILPAEGKILFHKMRRAEQLRAVDYLERKMPDASDSMFVERNNGKDEDFRLMLTLRGYKAYERLITKDMIQRLTARKVPLRNMFRLTDKFGHPVFDGRGSLTEEGVEVFYALVVGDKAYYLPGEKLPESVLASMSEADKTRLKYTKKGYEEITRAEYDWLLETTRCPQEVLTGQLSLKIAPAGGDSLYFILPSGGRGKGFLKQYLRFYGAAESGPKVEEKPDQKKRILLTKSRTEPLCDADGKFKK
ncbi:MAG: tetratricopeptide repeat protein [Elusimicrobiaceae bacterium]